MLNFSELAAFTRAFHRWSGETPSDYRAKHNPALV
jgi:AraC-like DNA-binding protein